MRILLTEGAGLTSRQVATQLDGLGHHVVGRRRPTPCASPASLVTFVRSCPSPSSAGTPGLVRPSARGGAGRQIDVVFPTQEQVAVLSHQLPRLIDAGLVTAVPPFASLVQVQDKVSARRTLERLGMSQPRSVVVTDESGFGPLDHLPGLREGAGRHGIDRRGARGRSVGIGRGLLAASRRGGALSDGGVLVQEALQGTFVMAQCVFDAGTLVAFHAVERVAGGRQRQRAAKASVEMPRLRQDLAHLGRALGGMAGSRWMPSWWTADPFVIDVNARLVEPANALAAGTDLVATLLAVAVGHVRPPGPAFPRRRAHAPAPDGAYSARRERSGRRRRRAARDRSPCLARRGVYADSVEELLPLHRDWRTIVPMVGASRDDVGQA